MHRFDEFYMKKVLKIVFILTLQHIVQNNVLTYENKLMLNINIFIKLN